MSSLEEENENAIWVIYYYSNNAAMTLKWKSLSANAIFKFDTSNWILVTICWGIFWKLNLKIPFLYHIN